MLFLFCFALALIVISGCTHEEQDKGTDLAVDFDIVFSGDKDSDWPDSRLEERFTDYWALRFKGDAYGIYRMEAPYLQALIPEGQYRNYVRGTARNTLSKIEIFDISLRSDNFVEISMTLHFVTDGGREQSTCRRDRWVKTGEEWHHVIRDPLFFPAAS